MGKEKESFEPWTTPRCRGKDTLQSKPASNVIVGNKLRGSQHGGLDARTSISKPKGMKKTGMGFTKEMPSEPIEENIVASVERTSRTEQQVQAERKSRKSVVGSKVHEKTGSHSQSWNLNGREENVVPEQIDDEDVLLEPEPLDSGSGIGKDFLELLFVE